MTVYIYIAITVIVTILFLMLGLKNNKYDVNNGILVMLAATLITLIIYATDTHRMAEYQQKMYFSPRITSYLIADTVDTNTVLAKIRYQNLTDFYVQVYTTFTITCFKDTVEIEGDYYTGKKLRMIPPLGIRTGGIRIFNTDLEKVKRTIQELRKRNEKEALILNVQLKLSNDYGGNTDVETKYTYNFGSRNWEEFY